MPAVAAQVAKPARRLCPEKPSGAIPAALLAEAGLGGARLCCRFPKTAGQPMGPALYLCADSVRWQWQGQGWWGQPPAHPEYQRRCPCCHGDFDEVGRVKPPIRNNHAQRQGAQGQKFGRQGNQPQARHQQRGQPLAIVIQGGPAIQQTQQIIGRAVFARCYHCLRDGSPNRPFAAKALAHPFACEGRCHHAHRV